MNPGTLVQLVRCNRADVGFGMCEGDVGEVVEWADDGTTFVRWWRTAESWWVHKTQLKILGDDK